MSTKKKTPVARMKKLVLPALVQDQLDDLCNEGILELHKLLSFNSPNVVVAAVQKHIEPEVKRLSKRKDDVIARMEEKIKKLKSGDYNEDDLDEADEY